MKEDDVLGRVRDHVRDERKDDAALEAIARGESTGASEALEAAATRGDDDAKALVTASEPLGDDVLEAIAAKVAPKRAGEVPVAPERAGAAPGKPKRSVVRILTLAAGPIALAAAMVLYVTSSRGPEGPSLPEYAISAAGEASMRGDTPAPSSRLRVSDKPGASFQILARPNVAATTRVAAWAFAIGGDAEAGREPNPLDAKIEVAPEGSVKITGSTKALVGVREVRVLVAPADALAKFDEALAIAKEKDASSSGRVRVFTVAIDR